MTMNACVPESDVNDTIKLNGIDYYNPLQPVELDINNVIDVLYNPDEDVFYMEYENVFDEIYGDYIIVYIADGDYKERFDEFLSDYRRCNLDSWYIDQVDAKCWLHHD